MCSGQNSLNIKYNNEKHDENFLMSHRMKVHTRVLLKLNAKSGVRVAKFSLKSVPHNHELMKHEDFESSYFLCYTLKKS